MNTNRWPSILVVLMAMTQACAPARFRAELAPGYLRCGPERIKFSRLDRDTYRATGCGRGMDYRCGIDGCAASELAESQRRAWCAATAEHGSRAPELLAVAAPSPPLQPALSKAQIKGVIHGLEYHVRACSECTLEREGAVGPPFADQRMKMRFVIAPDGHVVTAKVVESAADPLLGECVAGVIRDAQFPRPANGGRVVVEYPYVFHPVP